MSGQGAMGDRHCLGEVGWLVARGVVLLAIAVVLFVAMACQQPAPTNQPPTTRENVCGEPGVCEGSATTEHPGCDVPGVAVFDLDGRPICEADG